MNRREIKYYDVSPFAALSAKATASNNLQGFSNVQNLFDESLQFRSIQTCEHNYVVLDGTHNAMKQSETIAVWSSQQSRLSDRYLPQAVTIDITFGGLQSSDGISFVFDPDNNGYADTVYAIWYSGTTVLSYKVFSPDSPEYSFENSVNYYDKISLSFITLNMPYRFLKIEAIYFGLVRVFGDHELESLTINEGFDPTANSIYINSMNFSINTKDPVPYLFRRRQPLIVRYNGVHMGRYYIDKSTRRADRRFDVEAIDKIGVLDAASEFMGDMYVNTPVSLVIDRIINGLFPYTIDPSLQFVLINGWLPILKRRDALALVAMAIGAVIDATRTDVIQIKPMPTELSEVIPKSRVYLPPAVNLEFPYTSVEVIEHNYVSTYAVKDLYKDTFTGTITVKFSEPMIIHPYTTGPVQILESGTNYMVIQSDGSAEVSVQGYTYLDNQNSVVVKTPLLIEGTEERAITIDKGTLINRNNSQVIAQRLYDYYQRQEVFDGEFVARLPNPEIIGDVVQVATVFEDGDTTGQIEKLSINLGYANIKMRGTIRGN